MVGGDSHDPERHNNDADDQYEEEEEEEEASPGRRRPIAPIFYNKHPVKTVECEHLVNGPQTSIEADVEEDDIMDPSGGWQNTKAIIFIDRLSVAVGAFLLSAALQIWFPLFANYYTTIPGWFTCFVVLLMIFVFDMLFAAIAVRLLIHPLYQEYTAPTYGIVTTKVEARAPQQQRLKRYLSILYSVGNKAYKTKLYMSPASFRTIERYTVIELMYIPGEPESATIHSVLEKALARPRRFLWCLILVKLLLLDWTSVGIAVRDLPTGIAFAEIFFAAILQLSFAVSARRAAQKLKAYKLYSAREWTALKVERDEDGRTKFLNARTDHVQYAINFQHDNDSSSSSNEQASAMRNLEIA